MEKTCTDCKQELSFSEFYKAKKGKFGLAAVCKQCHSRYMQQHKSKPDVKLAIQRQNKEYQQRPEIHERLKEQSLAWYRNHREQALVRGRKWKLDNPEKRKAQSRLYNHAAKRRNYVKQYRATTKRNLHNRISWGVWKSLRQRKAGRSWEKLVGYTVEDLMKHLEKQFVEDMSWENMGAWEIDHKTPIAALHFEKPEDLGFKTCWSLENLQPLWTIENNHKSCKVDKTLFVMAA